MCDDGFQLSVLDQARLLLMGGVRTLQIRLKQTPPRAAIEAIRQVAGQCRASGTVCLVNDRVDWALAAGADGAHVGDEDLPPREARHALGPERILGVTVRRAMPVEGATYLGLGPIFESSTKALTATPLGLEGLKAEVAKSPLPVVAIAGICLDNIRDVAAAGAWGAAVISDLLRSSDIPVHARMLRAAFDAGAA